MTERWIQDRHYLMVPFDDKDRAKRLGARWDFEKKKWYYTGNDGRRFAEWIPPEAAKVSDLSEEQQQMIALAKEGRNVLVDACIGSGKTTTIQTLCNEMTDKQILYLTYNRLLKVDAKSKITENNVTVTNYHGFASMILRNAGISSGVAELIQTLLANSEKIVIPRYDLLVIDEYQDIDREISEMLECIKDQNPGIQIVAVGDMKQKIYDKTTLDAAEFISDFLEDFERVSFTQCFRLSAPLAARLGRIWEKPINGVNKNCTVRTMALDDTVSFLASQNPADILCLGKRDGLMASVLNELERKYPSRFNKRTVYASINDRDSGGATEPTKSTAIFTTFDGSKGLERKICVVFDYTLDYWSSRSLAPDTKYEILRNIFCVAMSRGKQQIIIVANDPNQVLSEDILSVPFKTRKEYLRAFQVSEMFDFKYDEDIEDCYSLIRKRKIRRSDNTVIDIDSTDCMIDLSPCIGIYQEASFFKKYDIMQQIEYVKDFHDDKALLQLKPGATMEDKVLFLTAYETKQDRYYCQVKPPFITDEQSEAIHKRLATEFTGNENVQQDFTMNLSDASDVPYCICGRPDVIKNNTVFELKFVNELEHKHFLQCAVYMVAFGLKKGILWNVKTNERYSISIPDEEMFIQAVMKTVTKGSAKRAYIETCDCAKRAS